MPALPGGQGVLCPFHSQARGWTSRSQLLGATQVGWAGVSWWGPSSGPWGALPPPHKDTQWLRGWWWLQDPGEPFCVNPESSLQRGRWPWLNGAGQLQPRPRPSPGPARTRHDHCAHRIPVQTKVRPVLRREQRSASSGRPPAQAPQGNLRPEPAPRRPAGPSAGVTVPVSLGTGLQLLRRVLFPRGDKGSVL